MKERIGLRNVRLVHDDDPICAVSIADTDVGIKIVEGEAERRWLLPIEARVLGYFDNNVPVLQEPAIEGVVVWTGAIDGDNEGATCILYPEFLKSVANKFNNNFYILPLSTESIGFVDASIIEDSIGLLAEVIYKHNRLLIDPNKRLSDSVWYYDRSHETFHTVHNGGNPFEGEADDWKE